MGNELPLDPSEVRARFSDRVDELDRLRTTAFHRQVVGALTAVLVDAPEGAALELGCGAGALLCVWRAAGRAAVGLDLTPKMCVRARAVSGCGVVTADACRLPFAGGSFAVVAGTFYLQIVADPVAALREARRTLVSGGIHGVIVQSREWTEEAAETMGSRLGITQQERDAMLARIEPRAQNPAD